MNQALLPHLNYAACSDPGKKRLANEDATFCDDRMGLFVVCDGVGGKPSGEAASQIIAYSLGHLIRRQLRQRQKVSPQALSKLLSDVVRSMNAQLHTHANGLETLRGMGATLVAALIDGRTAHIVHVGDSRVYLLRRGTLGQVTADHSALQNKQRPSSETGELMDLGERRVLTQFIGRAGGVKPAINRLELEPGDQLLLCTDGLTDVVKDKQLEQALNDAESPSSACSMLVDQANAQGGPDNVTLVIAEFRGLRKINVHDSANHVHSAQTGQAPRGTAREVYEALQALADDMAWLAEGAKEAAAPSRLSALAAIKRRVGHQLYRTYLERHPGSKNPAYIFHQLCANPDNPWRKRYQHHIDVLHAPLEKLTAGDVRLSPILSSEETAMILKTLWRDWRAVEHRYFATCQREAIDAEEKTLDILIDHMHQSVRTLSGLLALLPRFMREGPTASTSSTWPTR